MADSQDDIGYEQGQVIAIGDEAQARTGGIVDHPDATPVLVVAKLGDDIGIRTYGPPSLETADLLDALAAQYRQTVLHAQRLRHQPKS